MESYKTLEVKCPTCGKMKNIKIPVAILSQKKFGIIKIQVPFNAVCPEHQFLVFVDIKGIIRGYEKIDIQMASITRKIGMEAPDRINLKNLLQVFGPYGIFSLIHAKIFNYPAYIIKDDQFTIDEDTLNTTGDLILPETYRGNRSIYLLGETNLDKIKLKEKESLVIDSYQNIYQIPWNEKLKFEEEIVKRALDIIDEQEQVKLLQQDIAGFIKEANHAVSILEQVKEIYDNDLIDQISNRMKIKKISSYRLNLIKEFIKRNISAKLAARIKNRVGEFLSMI